jgi:hypothetical protein
MRFLICCAALVFTTVVSAQDISDEMKTDTKAFLDLTGALEIGDQMGNAISQQIIRQNPNAPAGAADVIAEVVHENVDSLINSPETLDGLVAIYAKYYTHEDILALIEFYTSPLGTKMIAIGPQIAQESTQFSRNLFVQRVPQIQQDIQERLQAAGLTQTPPAP